MNNNVLIYDREEIERMVGKNDWTILESRAQILDEK